MGNYNDEYRKYYSQLRGKINSNEDNSIFRNNKRENSVEYIEDIPEMYPNYNSVKGESNNTSYKGSYYSRYYSTSRSNAYDTDSKNKQWSNMYIHKLMIRLTITGILFCLVLLLKVAPYNKTKELYSYCKDVVNTSFDYNSFVSSLEVFGRNLKNELEEKIETFYPLKEDEIKSFKQQDNIENIDKIEESFLK